MGILKIKDWAKSKPGTKQFQPLLITTINEMVVSVERLHDCKVFDIDQCVYTQGKMIANDFKELSVYVTEFLSDNIHVKIMGKAKGKNNSWVFTEPATVEINHMEACATFLIDDLAMKVAYPTA